MRSFTGILTRISETSMVESQSNQHWDSLDSEQMKEYFEVV